MDLAGLARGRLPDHKADGDTNLDRVFKDVVAFPAENLTARSGISLEVDDVDIAELLGSDFAEAIIVRFFGKAVVRDEGYDAVIPEAICRPSEEAGVHIVLLCVLRRRLLHIGLFDQLIDVRIGSILVVVVHSVGWRCKADCQ